MYLKVEGILSSLHRTMTKKIDLCNYDENDAANQDKWEVDSYGEFGPFFSAVVD